MDAMPPITDAMMDQMLFESVDTTMILQTHASFAGVLINTLILGMMATYIPRYYHHFSAKDPWVYKIFVAVGGAMIVTQFGFGIDMCLICFDVLEGTTTFFANMWWLNIMSQTIIFFHICLNTFAAIYFCQRAWKMLGPRRWIMYPWLLVIPGCMVIQLAAVGVGYRMPFARDLEQLMAMSDWFNKMHNLYLAATATSMSLDTLVCLTMLATFYKSRVEFKQTNPRLLRKLVLITVESLSVPVAINIALMIIFVKQGATMAHWDIMLVWALGPSIYMSVLFSLTARQTIAEIVKAPSKHRFVGGQLPSHLIRHETSSGDSRSTHVPTHTVNTSTGSGSLPLIPQLPPVKVDKRASLGLSIVPSPYAQIDEKHPETPVSPATTKSYSSLHAAALEGHDVFMKNSYV